MGRSFLSVKLAAVFGVLVAVVVVMQGGVRLDAAMTGQQAAAYAPIHGAAPGGAERSIAFRACSSATAQPRVHRSATGTSVSPVKRT